MRNPSQVLIINACPSFVILLSPNTIDNEIMGFKEELSEQRHSEDAITKAIQSAYEDFKAQGRRPDLERIEEKLTAPRKDISKLVRGIT